MNEDKEYKVAEVLMKRAVSDSADYVEKNMDNPLIFFDNLKSKMYSYALNQMVIDGYIAEFGVYKAEVTNAIAKVLPEKTIYGFDSFYGLPEDWSGWEMFKGEFSLNGIKPTVLSNVELVEGLFESSLPNWLKTHKDPFSLLIIDSDTYNSAKTILNNIGTDQIVNGTLILFDEYFGYINWRQHEFKAWQEFVKKYEIDYEYLAINHLQVLIKVKNIKNKKSNI
jgi:hypothetical protein